MTVAFGELGQEAAESAVLSVERELGEDAGPLFLQRCLDGSGERLEQALGLVRAQYLHERARLADVLGECANQLGIVLPDLATEQLLELSILAYQPLHALAEASGVRIEVDAQLRLEARADV